MPGAPSSAGTPPGPIVLRQTAERKWQLVGEADRRPGLTARAARVQAVGDATNGSAKDDEVYAAILRSEWPISFEL
ncbi:MAG TPA: hypothetical protein VMW80_07730 [Candidatus Dormibacteraeota bacterium]|nr:hypothetical protein [Candidatus Dormibacteraeota bacterium]